MRTEIKVDSERLLQTFLELVRINSPSGDETPVREYLANRFELLKLLGQTDEAGNLMVKVPGNRSQSRLTLALTGHMDVVPPCLDIKPIVEGKEDNSLIRSSGDTVLGADDKSALAAMLEALQLSITYNLPRPELTFLFTTREEVMLGGAKEMDREWYGDADFVVALDHSGQQGTVVYEAPTYVKFTVTVNGKSVHAGIMPEKGINAIQILSWAMEKIKFGRLNDSTTKNLGFIYGGKAPNIVPDLAGVQGEIRAHDETQLQKELNHIEKTLHDLIDPIEGASFEFSSERCFKHYRTDPEDPGVRRVIKALDSLDISPDLVRTNGGSDINIFVKNGIPGVVLSAGYIEPHSLNERIFLKDMITSTYVILAIWEQFALP